MCVMSMVMDHYHDKWWEKYIQPSVPSPLPCVPSPLPVVLPQPTISREEVEEFRKLLERAREYDKRHNQPDCELEEKKEEFRKLAEELGVEISFV